MNDYLSTEDLVLYLNKPDKIEVKTKKKFKLNKKHLFGSIVVIAVLHLVFMSLPLVLGQQTKDILGYQYGIAIDRSQEIDEVVEGRLYRITPIDINDIEIGSYVLILGLYGNQYYWEVEVLEVDIDNQTIRATFDDIISRTYHIDDVSGVIADSTNLIGAIYYTASTPRGFISMVILHALILYGTYYMMFQNKRKLTHKGESNEIK